VIKVRILPIFIFFLCHVNPNAYQNWKRRWKWRKNAFCYQCKNDTRLLWMRHVKLVDLKIKIYSETSQIFFSRLKKLNLLKCAKITKSWNFKVLNKFFNIFHPSLYSFLNFRSQFIFNTLFHSKFIFDFRERMRKFANNTKNTSHFEFSKKAFKKNIEALAKRYVT
jgi:hypothetical protein